MLKHWTDLLMLPDDLAVIQDFKAGECLLDVRRTRHNGEEVAYTVTSIDEVEQAVLAHATRHVSAWPIILYFEWPYSHWRYERALKKEEVDLILKDVKEDPAWL